MNGLVAIGTGAAAVTLVGYGFNRILRWAAGRGWVYNKHNPRPSGSGTTILFDQIFHPSIEHVLEEQSSERIRADRDESGEGPDVGTAG